MNPESKKSMINVGATKERDKRDLSLENRNPPTVIQDKDGKIIPTSRKKIQIKAKPVNEAAEKMRQEIEDIYRKGLK